MKFIRSYLQGNVLREDGTPIEFTGGIYETDKEEEISLLQSLGYAEAPADAVAQDAPAAQTGVTGQISSSKVTAK